MPSRRTHAKKSLPWGASQAEKEAQIAESRMMDKKIKQKEEKMARRASWAKRREDQLDEKINMAKVEMRKKIKEAKNRNFEKQN